MAELNLFQNHEDSVIAPNKVWLPCAIVTGPLGSGKTTLLKHILRSKRNLNIKLVVHDWAPDNVDAQLLEPSADRNLACGHTVDAVSGGCPCCSKDVLATFKSAVTRHIQEIDGAVTAGIVDYMIIETSGVTDPVALVKLLDQKFGAMYKARLDVVITVVDQEVMGEVEDVSRDSSDEIKDIRRQVETADVVILNKDDLVDREKSQQVEQAIRRVNPLCAVHRCTFGTIDLPLILDVELDTKDKGGVVTHGEACHASSEFHNSNKKHQTSAGRSLAVEPSNHQQAIGHAAVGITSPISLQRVEDVFGPKFGQWGENVLRVKGFVWFAEVPDTRYVLHLSGKRRLEIEIDGKWQGEPRTQLVIIGRALPESVGDIVAHLLCEEPRVSVPWKIDDAAVAPFHCSPDFVTFVWRGLECFRHGHSSTDHERLNRMLVARINSRSASGVLLLPIVCGENDRGCLMTLRHSDPNAVWAIVSKIGQECQTDASRSSCACVDFREAALLTRDSNAT
mmetsp:Transcript_38728/g.88705  ORF Transcript_38728/g.88705 Transcript_38728/m.88705 type:complete len:508 (+) Transcript_38728:71-1594(+)